jgi:hypothetical protein
LNNYKTKGIDIQNLFNSIHIYPTANFLLSFKI